jgi:UDP-GlcNAc:undecaprenyl-phosphate/decaprenyl-phosphate GlcNAc-1-phosphate transferase
LLVDGPSIRCIAVYCVNAFLLSVVLTSILERWGKHFRLVDKPTARKNHEGQIPLAGAAVYIAFNAAALLLDRWPLDFTNFFIGLTLVVSIGIADDMADLRPLFKLAAQGLAAAVVVWPSGFLIQSIGNLVDGRPIMLAAWALPVTIFAVVGMINAINMIDGLDGLAGGICVTALAWFGVAAGLLGLRDELLLILLLVCSILGFLLFNIRHPWRARASVFLGDGGSMMLGMALAFVAIGLSQTRGPSLSPVAVLWVCALPVVDTLSLIVRRMASGLSPMAADRRHLHHLLLQAGLTVGQTVIVLICIAAALGGVGVAGWLLGLPDIVLLFALLAPVGLHVWFTTYGWKHLRMSRGDFHTTKVPVTQL